MPQIFHRSTNTLSRLSLFSALLLVARFLSLLAEIPRSSCITEADVVREQPVICATLLALTFATYRIALIDLGRWNIVAALTIAFCKATLVALFFMHLRYSPRRTQLVVLAGIFWLAIMMLLTMSDYLTRAWSAWSS